LQAGRELERRHRLHVDGRPSDLTRFLTEKKPGLLASPEAFDTLLTVQTPASATLLGSLLPVLDKVFTAPGATAYFEFSDPAYSDDFQDYLADTTRTGQTVAERFAALWKRQSIVGFQGVFLVDLLAPDEALVPGVTGVPLGPPEPTFSYIDSGQILDMEATGNRIEYLILYATDADGNKEYFCWDDQFCHRVQTVSGQLVYQPDLRTVHGLPYAPAFFVTTHAPDASRPVLRTSAIASALPLLDDYLLDYNWVRLGNAYHANPKMWSYGLDCDYVPHLSEQQLKEGCLPVSCVSGEGKVGIDGQPLSTCPRCKGTRKYIPVGPDKTYILAPPEANEVPLVNPGPAGYVVPDLTSLKYLAESCQAAEGRIEKAILGKAGILEMQTKTESGEAKKADLGPLTDRLNARGVDSITAEKAICDAEARLRYGVDNFKASALSRGRRYHFYDEQVVQAEYEQAKKGGADAGYLYSLLEDSLYAKFGSDPMELQRNLLKLELTPVPHLTSAEALKQGYIGERRLVQKDFLNNFFNRFERENGSILAFGSALPHDKKIAAIQLEFDRYVTEELGQQRPALVPGTYSADAGAPGGQPSAVPTGRPGNPGGTQPTGTGTGTPAAAGAAAQSGT
jgi:hypothetical protein